MVFDPFSLWEIREDLGYRCYEHKITKSRVSLPPHLPQGGIIANDMGLGRTLTMLSAIVASLADASHFSTLQYVHQNSISGPLRMRSTLIVVSSAMVLKRWITEINKHIRQNTLRVHTFHGAGRTTDLRTLVESDVVLTTYLTLVSDFSGASPVLQNLDRFRLVLDESTR
ncbi:SNF2 family N-terminal domain-containing protein [Cryomyces antarcticus]